MPNPVRQRSQDCIENRIQSRPHVFSEKPQHKISMLLQQRVFSAIAPVCIQTCQMLASVQFNDQPCLRAQQVHFHVSPSIEGNRQLSVQLEPACGFGQCLKSSIEECLGGTACSVNALGARIWFPRDMNK